MRTSSPKTDFLDSLTPAELHVLVHWLRPVCRPKFPQERNRSYLEKIQSVTLFGVLHKKLFGNYVHHGATIAKVMARSDEVKHMLQADIPAHNDHKAPLQHPPIPSGLQIHNELIGPVTVSVHAWDRFCERFCQRVRDSNHVATTLRTTFAQATKEVLKKEAALARLIKNKGVPVEYFLERSRSCRFVVIQEDGGQKLLTVEVPRF